MFEEHPRITVAVLNVRKNKKSLSSLHCLIIQRLSSKLHLETYSNFILDQEQWVLIIQDAPLLSVVIKS